MIVLLESPAFANVTETVAPLSPATVTAPAFASAAVALSAPLTTNKLAALGATVSSVKVKADEVPETKPPSVVSRNATEFGPSTAVKFSSPDLNVLAPSTLYCNPLGVPANPERLLTISVPMFVNRSVARPVSFFRLSSSCDTS